MDFRTKIEIASPKFQISHKNKILMFGSCFIENIGHQLIANKFNVNLNPFGILYNPKSIGQSLEFLIDKKVFSATDIVEHKGLYHSFHHHSSFSHQDKEICLSQINDKTKAASFDLRKADVLFITFGTAYTFINKTSKEVVGNCHKLPANNFDRYRLETDEIVTEWTILLNKLAEINPSLQIIFTVSPIRHVKDGMHDNQLSKSILLLAIDKLCKLREDCHYFPSYEIVLDELRDYRFYNEDMIHPSSVATKYIWERFSDAYMNDETHLIINEWQKIHKAIRHRPFNTNNEDYKFFLRQTLLNLKTFNQKYPYICCKDEITDLENKE